MRQDYGSPNPERRRLRRTTAVQGGRVVADWPGLATANLYEGRDLRPTVGLDQLIATTASECFALDPQRVARILFPQVAPAPALPRLLRA